MLVNEIWWMQVLPGRSGFNLNSAQLISKCTEPEFVKSSIFQISWLSPWLFTDVRKSWAEMTQLPRKSSRPNFSCVLWAEMNNYCILYSIVHYKYLLINWKKHSSISFSHLFSFWKLQWCLRENRKIVFFVNKQL